MQRRLVRLLDLSICFLLVGLYISMHSTNLFWRVQVIGATLPPMIVCCLPELLRLASRSFLRGKTSKSPFANDFKRSRDISYCASITSPSNAFRVGGVSWMFLRMDFPLSWKRAQER